MFIRSLFCLFVILVLLPVTAYQQEKATTPSLTLWLMPALPPVKETPISGSQFDRDLAEFNRRFGKYSPVTVLNTTKPDLLNQLIAWNPEYAGPSWAMIKGQEDALAELAGFSKENNIHINVRFINWSQAFSALKDAAEDKKSGSLSEDLPDVAQIGSTWVAYFADNGLLVPYDGSDLLTRDTQEVRRASVLYSVDARLIFYWKRNHLDVPSGSEFILKSDSWESLVESLQSRVLEKGEYPNPPMVMPIGLTLDLLHNYAPLVWAGEGDFLTPGYFGAKVDLTSEPAKKVPLYLARNISTKKGDDIPRPVLSFPEMSTEEATGHFLDGDYIAIHKPAGFIKRWYEKFAKDQAAQAGKEKAQVVFWDYAGVAVPPKPFKGGSDLMVLSGTGDKGLAFSLARFLATDERYTSIMARYEGYLPAQKRSFGVGYLIASLQNNSAPATGQSSPPVIPHRDMAALTSEYSGYVERAVNEGREYMQLSTFPVDIESHDSLESIQRLMRRIGEGDDDRQAGDRIKEAAGEAEVIINRRTNWLTKWLQRISDYWPYVATALLLIAIALGGFAWRLARLSKKGKIAEEQKVKALKDKVKVEEEKTKLLDQVVKVRGCAAASLLGLFELHSSLKDNRHRSLEDLRSNKPLVVAAQVQGWRRGQDPNNWVDTNLEEIAWRAIILALETSYQAQLFKKWEDSNGLSAQSFLRSERLLRDVEEPTKGHPQFYFRVDPSQNKVSMPFLLEQALVCLLQNAIVASADEEGVGYFPILITWDNNHKAVSVINKGDPLDDKLCKALNDSESLDEFERRIDDLLSENIETKPGIGLVEAYCIAKLCYGGLEVKVYPCQPKSLIRTTIRLNSNGKEH